MAKRFVRKVGREIMKYGAEITWDLYQYNDAEEKAEIIRHQDISLDIDFDLLFHIEKKLGNLGYENPNSELGIFINTYHSYQSARKSLYSHALKFLRR